MEVWDISQVFQGNANEPVVWFENRDTRVISSVMDSLGPIEGFRPGEYRFRRNECEMEILKKKYTGNVVTGESRIMDFQWTALDDDESFIFYNSIGIKEGYISAKGKDPDKIYYLWPLEKIFGDCLFRFTATGQCDTLGIRLQGMSTRDVSAEESYTFAFEPETGRIVSDESFTVAGNDAGERWSWDPDTPHTITAEKWGKQVIYRVDGKILGEHRDISLDGLFRPVIFYRNGKLRMDNLQCYEYPDLFYSFEFSQPYWLAFSDWDGEFKKVSPRGAYYSYLVLSNDDQPAILRSKREFVSDFMVAFVGQVRDFGIGIEEVGRAGESFHFMAQADKLTFFKDSEEAVVISLKEFSVKERLLTKVWLWMKDGVARIYLTDLQGTQRLVLEQRVDVGGKNPFRVKLLGNPVLALFEVHIWGQEYH